MSITSHFNCTIDKSPYYCGNMFYPRRAPHPETWDQVDDTYLPNHFSRKNIFDLTPEKKETIETSYLNPIGPTGITGRGILPHYGPVNASDVLLTRWKYENNTIMTDTESNYILQFLGIVRKDNNMVALPGGKVNKNETNFKAAIREFKEEALDILNKDIDTIKQIEPLVDKLFDNSVKIYSGYVDDPRNTDNAWMESTCYHIHVTDDTITSQLNFEAGDDASEIFWLDYTPYYNIKLYSSHCLFIDTAYNYLLNNMSFFQRHRNKCSDYLKCSIL